MLSQLRIRSSRSSLRVSFSFRSSSILSKQSPSSASSAHSTFSSISRSETRLSWHLQCHRSCWTAVNSVIGGLCITFSNSTVISTITDNANMIASSGRHPSVPLKHQHHHGRYGGYLLRSRWMFLLVSFHASPLRTSHAQKLCQSPGHSTHATDDTQTEIPADPNPAPPPPPPRPARAPRPTFGSLPRASQSRPFAALFPP